MEIYSLTTILSNLYSGNNDREWKRMYNLCRDHVAKSSAKYSMRLRIQRREWWTLKHHDVFDNVIITLSNGKLIPSYVDGTTKKEINQLRTIFNIFH